MATIRPLLPPIGNEHAAACPTCRTRYRIRYELSGKRVRCQKCQATMRVPQLPGPSSSASSPARGTDATHRPAMRANSWGLLLSAGSMLLMLAMAAASLGIEMLANQWSQYLPAIISGGLLVAGGMLLSGLVLNLRIPKISGARSFAIAALVLHVAAALWVGGAWLGSYLDMLTRIQSGLLQVGSWTLAACGFFLFLYFLMSTAEFTERPELAATARGIMRFQMLIIAGLTSLVLISMLLPGPGVDWVVPLLGGLVLLGSLINQIVLIVLQLQLAVHLRRTTARRGS